MKTLEELKNVDLTNITELEMEKQLDHVLKLQKEEQVNYFEHLLDNYVGYEANDENGDNIGINDSLSKTIIKYKDKLEDVFKMMITEMKTENKKSDEDDESGKENQL